MNRFILFSPPGVLVLFFIFRRYNSAVLKKILIPALIFFIAGSGFFSVRVCNEDPMTSWIGKEITIQAMVYTVQKKDKESYQLIVLPSGGRSKALINIYGDIEGAGIIERYGDLAGRLVEISGRPELPSERRNPGTFDYRLYLKTKGVNVIMNIKPFDIIVKEGGANVLLNVASNIRHDFSKKISSVMSIENAGIFSGMIFGDKTMIEDDIYEIFQKNGTAHILAVSGIHVGIVYLLFGRLLNARRNIFFNIVLLFIMLTYAALASFSPSIIRACGMIALHIASKIMCLRYDMLSAGAALALMMMMSNPFIIFDIGFQLSFLAIFILAIALPAAQRLYCGSVAATAVMQAGLAPATAYVFNYFSLTGFFINIPVILIAGIIIPMGIVLIPLSYISEQVFVVCAGFVDALCGIMYWLNEFTYTHGGLFFNAVSPPLTTIFLFYGLLFFGCSEAAWILLKRNKRLKLLSIAVVIIVLSLAATIPMADDLGGAQLVFVDVGQGDCLHIRTPGGKNILIDGGGSYSFDVGKKILIPYLLKNGVRKIDVALVSHRHLDHYNGIVSLANNFSLGRICLYESNRVIEGAILEETGLRKEQIEYLVKGQTIRVDKDVWIEALFPERKTADVYIEMAEEDADENENSLIMKVNYFGVSVLMTGDINFGGEADLISSIEGNAGILKCDFLKIPHHGSKYSSSDELLAAVNPSYAVFQVGKNNFGHPTAEVLEKCKDIGAEVYRNDKQGAICIFIKNDGEKPLIKTVIRDPSVYDD